MKVICRCTEGALEETKSANGPHDCSDVKYDHQNLNYAHIFKGLLLVKNNESCTFFILRQVSNTVAMN